MCNINWKNKVPGGQNYPHRISDRGNEKSMTDGRMEGVPLEVAIRSNKKGFVTLNHILQ